MTAKSLEILLAVALTAAPAMAQEPAGRLARQQRPAPTNPARNVEGRIVEDQNARETRQQLAELLQQYPPSLGEVLRLDPTLLSSEPYLAPYPALGAFLAKHPEVAHNPSYFVGEIRVRDPWSTDPRRPVIQMMENTLAGLAVLTGFIVLVTTVGWLLKSLLDYRRWLRISKVQTEAHSKLLDRFSSNEDLMAYIQTPAGRRFLESAPIPIDPGTRPIAAPISRILWSVQAGCVIALAGLGILYVSARLAGGGAGEAELAVPLFAIGIVALSLGLGFVLSAGVSYALSRRLGLFEGPAAALADQKPLP